MTYLNPLLENHRAPLLFVEQPSLTSTDFVAKVSRYSAQFAARPEQKWLLFEADLSTFACLFFALLCANKQLVLPPNDKPAQLDQLKDQFDATTGTCKVQGIPHFQPLDVADAHTAELLISDQAIVNFYTSGSTGQAKQVAKCWRQLSTEIFALEQLWGNQLGQASILASVSHQHIYGLIFKLLWPLLNGRSIYVKTINYPEELAQRLAAKHPLVFISSPAFLARTSEELLWQQNQSLFNAVFSSGGPLLNDTAQALTSALGCAPIEVFGSTETGGIGWRQQGDPPYLWHPFSLVTVAVDDSCGRLNISSPYLPNSDWYNSDDLAALHPDGRFELLGRADRVVKIEEKRLALDALEQQLCLHPFVAQCRALVLPAKRNTVAIAVVLSNSGQQALNKTHKRQLNELLKAHLASYFETVLLPRKWRYLTTLPVNSQGKIAIQQLIQLFE